MAGRGVDLRDPEQVDEYLENLSTEYRFGCYSEKNPEACHLLGDFMEAVKEDYAKAGTIYSVNCQEYNFPRSCHKAGSYKFSGKGTFKRDFEGSMALFGKACELGHPAACLNAGRLEQLEPDTKKVNQIILSKETPPDHQKALSMFKKGCDGGIGEACHRYSNAFIAGIQGIIEPNFKEAFDYAIKGCDLGFADSCVNAGLMFKKGEGVEANEKMAKRYFNMATDMMRQEREERDRVQFQQGVETAGGEAVRQ